LYKFANKFFEAYQYLQKQASAINKFCDSKPHGQGTPKVVCLNCLQHKVVFQLPKDKELQSITNCQQVVTRNVKAV